MIQLAFYKGRKRLSNRVIADLTAGPYSHVEFVLAHFTNGWALCLSASMMDGGVRIKAINISTANWAVVTVKTDVTVDDAWAWFYRHSSAKYDHSGALGYKLPFLKPNPRKKYCSKAISEILNLPNSNHPNGLFDDLQSYVIF